MIENIQPRKTIDVTPTWIGLIPALLAVVQDGTKEGREEAIKNIKHMARVADMSADRQKEFKRLELAFDGVFFIKVTKADDAEGNASYGCGSARLEEHLGYDMAEFILKQADEASDEFSMTLVKDLTKWEIAYQKKVN
jgi:hypothetical protein